jgi:uncharacterized integral membrane protein
LNFRESYTQNLAIAFFENGAHVEIIDFHFTMITCHVLYFNEVGKFRKISWNQKVIFLCCVDECSWN